MFVDRVVQKFPNAQSALVVAVALIVGLVLDYFVGGHPFRLMILVVGLGLCSVLFFLPHQMWTRNWKMMRVLSLLSLILILLTLFDSFVTKQISWMSIGFWAAIFVYSSYQWRVLRIAKRRIL